MEKHVQNLFSGIIGCDSLIQLKDGRLIFYYFREYYNFHIYDAKTFHKLFVIDLDKPI